jgi:TonB family protein
MDKPLTKDREDDLRQAGATDELIDVIRKNSPELVAQKADENVVDLGELVGRATNLVKPEYTAEAKQAGVTGVVRLQLTLDEQGRVVITKTIMSLPNGLTENSIAAAKNSTFAPASVNGKPARAVGTITYSFKLNKPDVTAALASADDARSKGNCDAAITEYERIIAVDPKQSKAFFGSGLCYLTKASYERAAASLDSAVALNQSDASSLFYLGVAYDYKGDVQTAAKNYASAISLDAELAKQSMTDCIFIDRRQITREETEAFGDSIVKACSSSLQNAPDFLTSLIYVKRGIGYRLKGEFNNAISDLENARRLNPRFNAVQNQILLAYNGRGLMHFNKKEFKAALEDVTTAININPQNPTPYVNRCVIYLYALRDYDKAIDDCSAAIRLTDKSSAAYNYRGYAYEMKKDLNNATTDYKKALEIDPKNEKASENLKRIQSAGSKPKY